MKKVLYFLITLFLTLPIGAQAQYDLGPYSELLKEGTEKDLMRLVAAIDNNVEAIQRTSETKYDELELQWLYLTNHVETSSSGFESSTS